MAKIPEPDNTIQSLIDKWHESQAKPPRPHMGASQLGEPCDRKLWLSFRWAVQEQFPGRIRRLFRRGNNEEATVISDLRAIGIDVRTPAGEQQRVNFGSHVSGSMDGIIESGVPGAPAARHVLEIKTHNKKSFDALVKDGVEKSKPLHYVQMQSYMHGTKINRTLYVAICKDDDRIYIERVRYKKEVAEKFIPRGQRIALANRMPEPISTDPSWHICSYCPSRKFCHETKLTKQINCRTCAHSTPMADSTWRCERHDADNIPLEFQRLGCDSHVLHPDLVPWPLDSDASTEIDAVYIIDGRPVKNGEPDVNVYSSKEIVANPSACASGGEVVEEIRQTFGARIVG